MMIWYRLRCIVQNRPHLDQVEQFIFRGVNQFVQGKAYDGKTDVWAIGCVLYEMCALKKAFDASNLGAITVKVMRYAHT